MSVSAFILFPTDLRLLPCIAPQLLTKYLFLPLLWNAELLLPCSCSCMTQEMFYLLDHTQQNYTVNQGLYKKALPKPLWTSKLNSNTLEISRKHQRRTLTVLLSSYSTCWTPFMFVHILHAVCKAFLVLLQYMDWRL